MFFFKKKKRPSVKNIAQDKPTYPLPTTRLISKRNLRTAVDKTTISASDISVPPSCSSTETDNTQSTRSLVSSLENISHESDQKADDTVIGNHDQDHEERSIATIPGSVATIPAHTAAVSIEEEGERCINDNASMISRNQKHTVQQHDDNLEPSSSVETSAIGDGNFRDGRALPEDVIIDKCPTDQALTIDDEEKPIEDINHIHYNNSNSASNRASGIPRLRLSASTIPNARTLIANNKTATSHIPVRKMHASSFNHSNNTMSPSSASNRITTGQCRPGRLVCGTRLPVRRA
ncbi:hypothetical protein O0I10_012184 [Lichtheimia ornata]|uniref:Uncharacterized protein n=1 Tax=Lichtheimia ornata TaxID=688661 RepID=A0AAD7URG4_9FUNG|nr:uncharacterized protein O0I10_012184 [Lichtheimia ornata]KAJ8652173.1 hypothetical protein O0I10_012184 [Lichtheimia ornata]